MKLALSLLVMALCIASSLAGEMLKVGDKAPDFSLQGSDGKTHKLSDSLGKEAVVIAWFPKAFTGGCTKECQSLKANGEAIRKYQAAYYAASVDDSELNKKFAESLGADFPILSDPTKATAKAYGVLNDKGMATRWTHFIAKDGTIAAIDTEVKPAEHGAHVAAKLKELGVATK